jgi:hypothetical protein
VPSGEDRMRKGRDTGAPHAGYEVPACECGATLRYRKSGAYFLQESHSKVHAFLLARTQAIPPTAKFLGELDFPRHVHNMPWKALCCQGHNAGNGVRRSDGCGFDSRFPPQNFPSATLVKKAPALLTVEPDFWGRSRRG